MALTDAQKVNVRRWMGYAAHGAPGGVVPFVFMSGSVTQELAARLDTLTGEEESVLVTTYLAALATLEHAIPGVSDNMDTQAAGPWKANPNELRDRTRLFNQWRRDMCAFLGFEPGPGLAGANSVSVSRC